MGRALQLIWKRHAHRGHALERGGVQEVSKAGELAQTALGLAP